MNTSPARLGRLNDVGDEMGTKKTAQNAGSMRRVGICTGGGDCPGLNAAIRAVVKHCLLNLNVEVFGIFDSFLGLERKPPHVRQLTLEDVSPILSRGGTILGTSNTGNPFAGKEGEEQLRHVVSTAKEYGMECLIVIGGEGTQAISFRMMKAGLPIIGVPKTIDNDLPGTEQTIGFATCVDLVADSVFKLQSTAESHDRAMILEVMGRDSGFIALYGGIAGGANVVLIPEIPFKLEPIIQRLRKRQAMGRNYSVIVVSEGAFEDGSKATYQQASSGTKLLGGIGQQLAQKLYDRCKFDTRVTVLGHLQRGGGPNAWDKILASQMGVYAADLAAKGDFNNLVVLKGGTIRHMPFDQVEPEKRRLIGADNQVIRTAEGLGICLGR